MILRQSAYEGGKVVSHSHRLPLRLISFLLQAESAPKHNKAGKIKSMESLRAPIGGIRSHNLKFMFDKD